MVCLHLLRRGSNATTFANRTRAEMDLGIESFATLSNGTRIFNPGWYRKAERILKTAQRRVARRKRGEQPAT